jgi:hypothetical protein
MNYTLQQGIFYLSYLGTNKHQNVMKPMTKSVFGFIFSALLGL